MYRLLSISILVFFGITSCNNQDSHDEGNYELTTHNKPDPAWITYQLDKYWKFDAPKGAKIIYEQGVDSTPGSIILTKNDTIFLAFDSGFEMSIRDTICNLGSETLRSKKAITRKDYKYLDKPDTLHQARIDTINGRIATIIKPAKAGAGITRISISDCNSHLWLGISGKDLPADKQELVLKIYNSIRQEASK